MTDKNIFTLDGNSYKEEDLDKTQKYFKSLIDTSNRYIFYPFHIDDLYKKM